MKRLMAVVLALITASAAHAQNLLVNGGFESGTGTVYYDGFAPAVFDDEPGWEFFLGAADGSYVQAAPDADPLAGTRDLDMGASTAGGGARTALGSRPAVTPLALYQASVTTDNYFGSTGVAYFIDWFDGGGGSLGSVGGPLTDADGFVFAPYTQLFTVNGAAPVGAASAGVRFQSGNLNYDGLTADHFAFSRIPEPSSVALAALGALAVLGGRRRQRA